MMRSLVGVAAFLVAFGCGARDDDAEGYIGIGIGIGHMPIPMRRPHRPAPDAGAPDGGAPTDAGGPG